MPKFDLPELPQPQGDELLAGLRDLIYRKDKRVQELREKLSLSKCEEQYWADAQLTVKQLFYNFLLLTVNNYL